MIEWEWLCWRAVEEIGMRLQYKGVGYSGGVCWEG